MNGLGVGAAVRAAGHTVVPVERVWLHAGARWAAGGREPVALVIRDARGARAVDMNGNPVPLAPLLAEVDGLEAALGTVGKGER